jgi:hypothetical protein
VNLAVIHVSEADAAGDLPGLPARACAGAEIVIESDVHPAPVLRAAEPPRRSISECVALAKKHEEETGEAPVLDPDFAADVEEIIRNASPGILRRGTDPRLMHGAYRAKDEPVERRRVAFIDRLCSDVPVHPVTVEIARSCY